MSRTHHHSRWGKRHHSKIDHGGWASHEPAWHVRLFMTRPNRRADATSLGRIMQGKTDPDDATLYTGTRKPHKYYW